MSRKLALLSVMVIAAATPAFASTIANVNAGGAGVYELPSELVVDVLNVAATTTTFTLHDSTGGVIVYAFPTSIYTPVVGDDIDITATNSPYQGAAELTKTAASVNVNSSGNYVAPPMIITANELAAGIAGGNPLAEEIVTLQGVSFPAGTLSLTTNTSYTISDASGSATVYPYKSDSQVAAAVAAANLAGILPGPVNMTGYVDDFNGTFELYPISISSAVPEPASLSVLGLSGIALLARRRR